MNNPIVTILIPAYNAAAFLPKCLETVLNQTYRYLQVVIVDDGSKDDTWAVCQRYASSDNRIEIYHQNNQGVATTRNHLLEKVKGNYVLFVDADDWIEMNMVEFLVYTAIRNNVEMVTCTSVKCCKEKKITIENWSQEKAVKEFLRHVTFAGMVWNKMIKTSIILDSRFDTRISYGEDALFCWQLLQRVNKIIVSNAQLYNHRLNEESLSNRKWTPENQGTGAIVWHTITLESQKWWPQYAEIAAARYAIEDMWALYFASLSNYPYDEHIKERQQNVRNNLKLIRKIGLVSRNKIIAAYALAYCYSLGKFMKHIK